MDNDQKKHRLERLMSGYAAAGLPLTSQRRALLEVLSGRDDHPTVDQIYGELAETIPEVSRTTVYRSLEALANLGLLHRVEHPGSAVRFDPNREPHHHFLCSECGSLSDLEKDALGGTAHLAYQGQYELQVEEISVLVRGRCHVCVEVA